MKTYWLICQLILIPFFAAAQDVEAINIAKEYLIAGELEKAEDSYEKLSGKTHNLKLIYADYVSILQLKRDKNSLKKFLKKAIKANPDNIFYKVDHYLAVKSEGNKRAQEKEFSILLKNIHLQSNWFASSGAYLITKKEYDDALNILYEGRKFLNNPNLFLEDVIQILKNQNRYDELIGESLEYLGNNPRELDNIQSILQQNLDNEAALNKLEEAVYKKIQQFPNEIVYNELLYWLCIQNRNFSKALVQARAIDRRKSNDGKTIVALGKIALDNQNYEDAIKIFSVVQAEQKKGEYYDYAIKNIVFAKEELIRNKFPVDVADVRSLSNEYRGMVAQLKQGIGVVEPLRKWALLNAFYLDNRDTAIILLQQAINAAGNNAYQRDLAKIDLADIYLLNNEPWESVLLYYQVEKTQKDQPLGYEAKLKNAKCSYFKKEFKLAAEHLDVLKIATTREIANDALYMSLLIRDNLIDDTLGIALSSFSQVGLLLFQNKIDIAKDSLEQMLIQFPNSSLTDDIHYELAKAYRKLGDYQKSINSLNIVLKNYAEGILGDDAALLIAKIYDIDLKDSLRAKEAYQFIITTYPGSIYTDEARKRFRQLRGDKI